VGLVRSCFSRAVGHFPNHHSSAQFSPLTSLLPHSPHSPLSSPFLRALIEETWCDGEGGRKGRVRDGDIVHVYLGPVGASHKQRPSHHKILRGDAE